MDYFNLLVNNKMGSGKGQTKRVSNKTIENDMDRITSRVKNNCSRIASMGSWPEYISPESLLSRIPTSKEVASGFDAGIAASLDLIPRNKQKLAAVLHAAYTPDAVAQVREEIKNLTANSETTWWLAACSICREGENTELDFLEQINDFRKLAQDPDARLKAAEETRDEMLNDFTLDNNGMPYAEKDGGMQGAYIAGYEVSAMYSENTGLYFVGTFNESLGLDGFKWREPANPTATTRDAQLGRSGPVHGSQQFVKCCDKEEYEAVIQRVKENGLL